MRLQHKEECIKLVAALLNIDLTDALLATVMAQSDHKAMASLPSKYDDHPVKLNRNEAMGRPRTAGIGGADAIDGVSGSQVPVSPHLSPPNQPCTAPCFLTRPPILGLVPKTLGVKRFMFFSSFLQLWLVYVMHGANACRAR